MKDVVNDLMALLLSNLWWNSISWWKQSHPPQGQWTEERGNKELGSPNIFQTCSSIDPKISTSGSHLVKFHHLPTAPQAGNQALNIRAFGWINNSTSFKILLKNLEDSFIYSETSIWPFLNQCDQLFQFNRVGKTSQKNNQMGKSILGTFTTNSVLYLFLVLHHLYCFIMTSRVKNLPY